MSSLGGYMDIYEYIKLSKQHDEKARFDTNSNEFSHFLTVWVKSRQPEIFKDLEANFRHLEPTIYAHRECESHDINF